MALLTVEFLWYATVQVAFLRTVVLALILAKLIGNMLQDFLCSFLVHTCLLGKTMHMDKDCFLALAVFGAIGELAHDRLL